MITIEKIIKNQKNQTIVKFLNLTIDKHIKSADEVSRWDEGGILFFEKYAKKLPDETKQIVGIHNVLINETSGEIFAFHFGRGTFVFKPDFESKNLKNSDHLRIGNTVDAQVDFRQLGHEWALLDRIADEDDDEEQLVLAYEFSKKTI